MSVFTTALLLSSFAGICTAIGGLLVMIKKEIKPKFLSLALGFSGGVMIYISMTELLTDSGSYLKNIYGAKMGSVWTAAAFLGGMALIGLIDNLVPEANNPHELSHVNMSVESNFNKKLMRSGIMTAIAIGIHNFPEGITTFTMSANNLALGLPITFAVAIHNIPEGIAVAAPIFKATGKRKKAFVWSLLSGISEPVGGIIGYLILKPFITDTLLGVIFGVVSGIMVYISLDELLPLAHEYGEEHTAIYGVFAGMAVMAESLILFM